MSVIVLRYKVKDIGQTSQFNFVFLLTLNILL